MTIMHISKALDVSEETVRRWIRSGQLKASELVSRKQGYRVRYEDLKIFVESKPKYKERLEVYLNDRKAIIVRDVKRVQKFAAVVLASKIMEKEMLKKVREGT